MPKVLHILRPAEGGMLNAANMLAVGLKEYGFEYELIGQDFIPDKFHPFGDWKASKRIRSYAKDADIVHAHGFRGAWVAGLAIGRTKPWVWTAHNLFAPPGKGLLKSLSAHCFKEHVKNAYCAISVSNAVQLSLQEYKIHSKQNRVIYGGVDFSVFEQLPSADTARSMLKLNAETPVICVVSRLSHEKGVDIAIRAMDIIWREYPNACLIIAGDGTERTSLQELAQSTMLKDNIKFLGFYNPLGVVYSVADVVVAPSRAEGLGLTAIEAMACGKAVVAADIGGLREVIEHDRTGKLFTFNNANALAEATLALLSDTATKRQIENAGKETALNNFSIKKSIEQTVKIYRDALALLI